MPKKNDNLKGQGFHTNPERINRAGAPKKTLGLVNSELLAQGYERVTNAQLVEAYELLLNLPLSKLTLIASHKIAVKEIVDGKEVNVFLKEETEYPALFRMVAKAMISQKGIDIIERMLDRAQGKVKQGLELSMQGDTVIKIVRDKEL